jgi:CcmD family protein
VEALTANNNYLFVAFSLVWVIFMVYSFTLSRRQERISRDLEDLKQSRGARQV